MTRDEFEDHLDAMQLEESRVLIDGQKEYAHDPNNTHANFDRLADATGIAPEQVLWVYLMKHIDGISAWIRGHRSQRESVHGRIKDARAYLALLDAMVAREEG